MLKKVRRPISGPMPLRILVADDHAAVRQGVIRLMMRAFPNADIHEARNGQEVLDAVRSAAWEVLVLDINMPVFTGLEILPQIMDIAPDLRILVFTIHTHEQLALRLLKLGVAGYLTKDCTSEELTLAMRTIMAGGTYISPALAERMPILRDTPTASQPHDTLSVRELQVMRMLAGGMSVMNIAQTLSLHIGTVGTYRRNILRKLSLKNTLEIISYANRHGLVD